MTVWEETQRSWPRTPGGQKVMCPECGDTGYVGGKWADKHAEHVDCPDCGKRCPRRTVSMHRARCKERKT